MSDTPQLPVISLIVAMAQNGVIGRGNALPWRLPADLKRFREFTLGKPILMGRKTYESIGHPLPGRANLVLTRDRLWQPSGVIAVHSVEEALLQTRTCDELVAIGGAEIYRLLLPLARRIYLTHVHADVPGDTYFPAFDPGQWDDLDYRTLPADERHAYPVTFVTLERRTAPAAAAPRPH